ncbi:MAG: glycosyltransferase family 4 protein [Verrucomicrobiaceae bacterium]|nr:glycosyltransferase family 4 protein [Verrucomicrobiaceae bacterium]
MSKPAIIYASFDTFPSPKGAATHIAAFVRVLGEAYDNVDLVTLPGVQGVEAPEIAGVRHHPLPAIGENVITRALAYRSELARWWGKKRAPIVHVRSIFEGYPLAIRKHMICDRFVFEVNGLPSIELKYHYPEVDNDDVLLRKLRYQEQVCLEVADLVITVSEVNAAHLRSRGISAEKIRVIPNGVDTKLFNWREPTRPTERVFRVLYTGTMSRWQGVHLAIEAVQMLRRDYPAELVLAGPCRHQERKVIFRTIDRLGMAPYVSLLGPLPKVDLVDLLHESDAVLAPLPPNDRNIEQGCCPLKVLEAMAAGGPLVASDLPVVSALVEPEREALLVRPGSAKAIKDGLLRLREDAELGAKLSQAARTRVERDFTWQRAGESLLSCYREL